jgi:hypothetical protein
MDADGQHDSTEIARFMAQLETADMVVGTRDKSAMVAVRRPGKWVLSKVAAFLVGKHIPDINSGFRVLYRKDGLRYLPILPNGFSLTTTITLAMMRDGLDVCYLPIKVKPRASGKSTVRYFGDGARTLLLIIRVIMLFHPLKVFAPLSGMLFLLGSGYAAYTLVTETNLSDASVLLMISGLGILFLGLLADQIASLRRGV